MGHEFLNNEKVFIKDYDLRVLRKNELNLFYQELNKKYPHNIFPYNGHYQYNVLAPYCAIDKD